MYKVYVYGAGKEYDNFMSIYPLYNSIIQVMGIVTSEEQYFRYIDGFKVIQIDKIRSIDIDFIIIAVEKWLEIFNKLLEMGIDHKMILRSNIFKLPFFDFDKYIKLRDSNVTILSNSCIGGRIYNKLSLETLSPTKNMYCIGKDFVKFCNNIEYYVKQEMKELDSNNITEGSIGLEDFFPKGKLDDLVWTFNHDIYAEEAINKWNERIKKINLNNIAVIMILLRDSDVELFDQINCEKKIGVYYKNVYHKNILYCSQWNDKRIRHNYMSNWIMCANDFLQEQAKIDWVKFLGGETDYIRCGV